MALVLGLAFVFEGVVIARARALPSGSEGVFFALVHLNVVGIGVLAFFLARNVTKLVTDRRRGIIGSKLSMKFVLSLVVTAAIPTTALFILSAFFITHTLDTWFERQFSEGLRDSLEIAEVYEDQVRASALHAASSVASRLEREAPGVQTDPELRSLRAFAERVQGEYELDALEILGASGQPLASAADPESDLGRLAVTDAELLRQALDRGIGARAQELPQGRRWVAVARVESARPGPARLVAVSRFIPSGVELRAERIREALDAYRRMQPSEGPFRGSVLLLLGMLTGVSLLFSSWMGFRLAKQVADPIARVSAATRELAAGNLDVRVEADGDDEIGLLVAAFNRMAADLETSRSDLEQRRALMEIILGGVGAGVISLDREGAVTTVNPSALRLFEIERAPWSGCKIGELLRGDALQTLEELLRHLGVGSSELLRRQVPIQVGGDERIFNWTLSRLRDAEGEQAGVVIVIDDVTQIVKGQRMEAWRDVARRMAHEIKNPLTPIQLSAQRLARKLGGQLADPAGQRVLRECTDAITGQVEAMKLLLSEFSNFARLPATDPVRTDLTRLARDAVALYKGKPGLTLRAELDSDLPELDVDREQIKRVLLNLIDNAIHAIDVAGEGPRELSVSTRFDPAVGTVQVEVADTGCGIGPAERARIFQPGFSTKAYGSGIGLAIVSRIVSDHSGTIRVRSNEPRGARFVIELPARA